MLTLGRAGFKQTICDQPVIAAAMLDELAARLRERTNYAEHLANPSALQRVGWLILDLAQRRCTGDEWDAHRSRSDAGQSRQHVRRGARNGQSRTGSFS
jgi:hypothetical protein